MKQPGLARFFPGLIIPLALVGLVIAVMLPYMPPHYVNRDSGIFLYIGREITLGKLLYVDAWDHKGPLLFYLNALGYIFGKRTGVWVIECIFLFISVFVGHTLLKRYFGIRYALWGTLAWIYSFFSILVGGNFSEEYALPFSFLSIFFFDQYIKKKRNIYLILIGATMGLCILLRPNNIGAQLVISSILFLSQVWNRQFKHAFQTGLYISAGTILALAPAFLWFFYQGALDQFLNATFFFNWLYAAKGTDPVSTVLILFGLAIGWPGWLAIIAWGSLLVSFITKKQGLPSSLALFLIFGLPLEIYLATLSTHPYIHYALSLMPYLAFLNAYFLSNFIPFFRRQDRLVRMAMAVIFLSTLLFSFWSAREFVLRIDETSPKINESSEMVIFIKTNTTESDYVLVWGQEVSINVLTERESPTPFAHQTFFLIPGMITPSVEQTFLSDLQKNKPAIIVITDALPFSYGHPENLEEQLNTVTLGSRNIFRAFSEYVSRNYHLTKVINTWAIYAIN